MGTNQTLDDVLAHYGILGMKWGVRRSDQQLEKARARRKKKDKPVTPTKKSGDATAAEAVQKKAKKGGVKALSNAEIKELNKRLSLETEYNRLTSGDNKDVSTGKKVAKTVMSEAGKMAANVARSEGQRILAQEVRKKVIRG